MVGNYGTFSMNFVISSQSQLKSAQRAQNLRAGCSKAAQLLDVAKRPIPQG